MPFSILSSGRESEPATRKPRDLQRETLLHPPNIIIDCDISLGEILSKRAMAHSRAWFDGPMLTLFSCLMKGEKRIDSQIERFMTLTENPQGRSIAGQWRQIFGRGEQRPCPIFITLQENR